MLNWITDLYVRVRRRRRVLKLAAALRHTRLVFIVGFGGVTEPVGVELDGEIFALLWLHKRVPDLACIPRAEPYTTAYLTSYVAKICGQVRVSGHFEFDGTTKRMRLVKSTTPEEGKES